MSLLFVSVPFIRVLFINILFINMSSMPSIRLLFMNTNNINLAINQQLSESNRAYNLSKQINAVNNGLSLKSRVIYCGTVICLIRNRMELR